jgi:3-phenylpropionate/trans-cinnamate dioxygenase ferredoxin reductase component
MSVALRRGHTSVPSGKTPAGADAKSAMSPNLRADRQTFVIVGAGLAGAKAAEILREEGFDGRVVLFGVEPERPYERPPLSKEYLRGETDRGQAYVHEAGFYDDHGIELRTRENVVRLDPGRRELTTRSDERLRYDRLLLSTGSAPRRLSSRGSELEGVHYLRTLDDSDALRARLEAGGRLVIVGGGWIGCEIAASARQRGVEVTVVAPHSVPFERVLGAEVGAIYREIHVDHGVDMLLGTAVAALEGAHRVERIRLNDGRTIDCDSVVVGIGATPRAMLAAAAGLAVHNGILVDDRLETSAPGIFAAGDVANQLHPFFGRLRVEHWDNALQQGPAAARSMLGSTDSYARLPYFFSDQYDVGMEYTGHATDWDRVVLRGDPATREFIAFWLREGRVLAGMNVNVWDVAETIRALIGHPVDERRLADTDVPLEQATLGEVAS